MAPKTAKAGPRTVISLHMPGATYALVKKAARKAKKTMSKYIRDAAAGLASQDLADGTKAA